MSLNRRWRATERRLLAWFAGSVVTLPLSYVWAQQLLTRSRLAAVLLAVTACALPYVFGGALFQSFRALKRKVKLERPVRAALESDNEKTFLGRLPDLGVGETSALTTDDLKAIEASLKNN